MNWAEVEAIGSWVAGIGTVGAVIMALYQARRDAIGKVRLFAGFRNILQRSLAGEDTMRNVLFLEITNVRPRNLNIDRVAWRLGKNKLVFFQRLDGQATSLPKTLSDGEKIHFEIERDEWVRVIINQIGNHNLTFLETKVLETLQFGASATNGQDFWQDAESGVKAALVKEAQSFLERNRNSS